MAPKKTRKKTRRRQSPTPPTREGTSGNGGKPGGYSTPNPRPGSSLRERIVQEPLAALALCLLVAVSYFPALSAGFVWDDAVLTGARPIQSLSGLWQIWFEPRSLLDYEGHYWPILYTTFWLEHKLWGFDPLGYHLVNLLLHSAVTLLLWRLLRRLAVPGAWLAAMIFAVHPLHVESVVWVMGRKDMLAALFYLAAALAYLRFVENRRWQGYAAMMALFVLGLLSKSIVITLPVSLLIWHWWKHGRVTMADIMRVLPLFLLGVCATFADLSYYKDRDPTTFDYSLIERALIAARAMGFYLGKLVWPGELAVIYPRWEVGIKDLFAWGCATGVAALTGLLWVYRHRVGRGPLAGLLFFVVTLSPTLGFVDYGYMLYSFVADRYQYLAGVGVIATLVGAATHGARTLAGGLSGGLSGARRAGVQAVAVALLLVLGTLTWRQAGIYRDNITFYSHIVALNPVARHAHSSLGLEYQNQGRYEDALAAYRTDYHLALQQPSPQIRTSRAYMGMGRAAESLGRIDEAEAHYRRAVENSPNFPPALDHLGAFWIGQKRYHEALEIFQALTAAQPESAKFHTGMGVVFAGLNRPEEALHSYDRALALDPYMKETRANREGILKFLQSKGD